MNTRVKRCPGCAQTRPSAEFGRNRAQRDGLAVYCRDCRATATRTAREQPQMPHEGKPCRDCGKRPRRDRGRGAICDLCSSRKYAEVRKAGQRRRRQLLRLELFDAYGGRCVKCGEGDTDVLVLDHIEDDGADHRRELGNQRVYEQLKRDGFPPIVQILCANDNMRKERERLGIGRQQIATKT